MSRYSMAERKILRGNVMALWVSKLLFQHRHGGGDEFFVRKCYGKYYALETLLLEKKEQCATVTGTPGEEHLCA